MADRKRGIKGLAENLHDLGVLTKEADQEYMLIKAEDLIDLTAGYLWWYGWLTPEEAVAYGRKKDTKKVKAS